jgi:anti-sigma factor RsiW
MTKPSRTRHDHAPTSHAGQSCIDLVTTISDYLDGELTEEHCRNLEAHLARCVCCGNLAESLRRSVAVCRASGQTRLPADVRRRARNRIAEVLTGSDRRDGRHP